MSKNEVQISQVVYRHLIVVYFHATCSVGPYSSGGDGNGSSSGSRSLRVHIGGTNSLDDFSGIEVLVLCFEHEQIKFESWTFSLPSTRWTFLRTLNMGIYRHVQLNTKQYALLWKGNTYCNETFGLTHCLDLIYTLYLDQLRNHIKFTPTPDTCNNHFYAIETNKKTNKQTTTTTTHILKATPNTKQ